MTIFCPIDISSRSTFVTAFCFHVQDPISLVPGKCRNHHYGDNPAPLPQPWARAPCWGCAGMLCSHNFGVIRARALSLHRAGSLVGCSAPEDVGFWWVGEKNLWKNGAPRNRGESAENMRRCLWALSPQILFPNTERLSQTAGGFLFFPLFNVGKTTFLLPSLLPPKLSWKRLNWFSWQY